MANRQDDTLVADQEPRPPFPEQHQIGPGLESKLRPRPRYEAPAYKPAGKLQNKVALITGGDSGIGRAVAVIFAREGADVALVYLPEEETDAEDTREAVAREKRKCLLLPGDLTSSRFCQDVVDRTVAEFGKLDILVSNAAHQNARIRSPISPTKSWPRRSRLTSMRTSAWRAPPLPRWNEAPSSLPPVPRQAFWARASCRITRQRRAQ